MLHPECKFGRCADCKAFDILKPPTINKKIELTDVKASSSFYFIASRTLTSSFVYYVFLSYPLTSLLVYYVFILLLLGIGGFGF
jgi:hypothetical protein